MVEMKPTKSKPKEDQTELLNSTVSTEFQSEDIRKCSVWCMFIYACLFIIYLFLVILLSWILRGYMYSLFMRYLHIENINEFLALEFNQENRNINHLNVANGLGKNNPEAFDIILKTIDTIGNGDNIGYQLGLDQVDYSSIQNDQKMSDELDSDDIFKKETSGVIEQDTLTGIINNMSDMLISELELVEEEIKSKAEKIGDNSKNRDDIDIFTDDIINNITNIIEEEIKFVEESFKINNDPTGTQLQNKNKDAAQNSGFMGYLANIFEHNNKNTDSSERSDDSESYYSFSLFSPYMAEHRFDVMEPMPEPETGHKQVEESEDVILDTARKSIRNLFNKENNNIHKEHPYNGMVKLKPEQQPNKMKMLLLAYLEIFGLVLAVMSGITFILMFIIHNCLKVQARNKVIRRYKLQESINEKDDHVI